jgi:hypothetical protein
VLEAMHVHVINTNDAIVDIIITVFMDGVPYFMLNVMAANA